MRSTVAVLALALVMLTVASPGMEAVAGCLEPCAEETPDQGTCSDDVCCSCCVHAGPLFTPLPLPESPLALSGSATPPDVPPVPPGRPSGILHVPKLSAA